MTKEKQQRAKAVEMARHLVAAWNPPKRRRWRMKRGGFEEAARLAGATAHGNRNAATVQVEELYHEVHELAMTRVLKGLEKELEERANAHGNRRAADVAPVRHGYWKIIHRHRGGFRQHTGRDAFGEEHTIMVDERYEIDDPYCSECGKLNESVFLDYCPNCGAKMDGGGDGEN